MTTEPIKNDQAVAQIFTIRPQQKVAAGEVKQSQSTLKPLKPSAAPLDKDFFSGVTRAPAKDAALRLNAMQANGDERLLQAKAALASKKAEEQMARMLEKMNEIVHSYPPFLRGSKQRQEYLMSISSIRQEIEQLSLPPNRPPHAIKEQQKMWGDLFSGVKIPTLAESGLYEASNAQITAAAVIVTSQQVVLAERRSSLEQQALHSFAAVSQSTAQYFSQATIQPLAQSGLPISSNISEVLKNL